MGALAARHLGIGRDAHAILQLGTIAAGNDLLRPQADGFGRIRVHHIAETLGPELLVEPLESGVSQAESCNVHEHYRCDYEQHDQSEYKLPRRSFSGMHGDFTTVRKREMNSTYPFHIKSVAMDGLNHYRSGARGHTAPARPNVRRPIPVPVICAGSRTRRSPMRPHR